MAVNSGGIVDKTHPLDPLSADEIRHVAAALRAAKEVGAGWRFASIELAEPAKDQLAAASETGERTAEAVCWDTRDGQAYRARVELPAGTVASWSRLPDGQEPNMTVDEWHECDEMLRRHPRL